MEILILVKVFILAYTDCMALEEKIVRKLIKSRQTVAVAESCSGGLLTHRLTNVPGCSKILKGSVIAYSKDAKTKMLKVSPRLITRHGAVSDRTAVAMAEGVRKALDTDFGISITGIAGPAGGSPSKPVGTTFVTVCSQTETLCLQCRFKGSRKTIKSRSATQALRLLHEFLI